MTFHTQALLKKLTRPRLALGQEPILYAPTYCYLGMTLDCQLAFKKHVDIVSRNLECSQKNDPPGCRLWRYPVHGVY